MNDNDNILDAAEKKSGPRICPECGFQYPVSLFIKRYVLKFGFSKWTCPNCSKLIKYNYYKSNLISLVGFLVCVFSFQALNSKFGFNLPFFLFLVPYFVFLFILLKNEKLEKHE